MFTVVNFLSDNTVDYVPTSWLIGRDEVSWPKVRARALNEWRSQMKEPEENWPSFKIKAMHPPADTEIQAREMSKLAEETSDLDTALEKRRKVKPLRYRQNTSPKKNRKKRVTASSSEVPDDSSLLSELENFNYDDRISDAPIDHFPPLEIVSLGNNTDATVNPLLSSVANAVDENQSNNEETEAIPSSSAFESPLGSLTPFEQMVLRELSQIREQLNQINLKVDLTLGRKLTSTAEAIPFKLPMTTVESLKDFNEWLSNGNQNETNFKNHIGILGGSNVGESVRIVLKGLIANSLAGFMNWAGKGGKLGINNLTILLKNIENLVRRSHPNAAKDEIKDAVQCWLKYASKRK